MMLRGKKALSKGLGRFNKLRKKTGNAKSSGAKAHLLQSAHAPNSPRSTYSVRSTNPVVNDLRMRSCLGRYYAQKTRCAHAGHEIL